VRLRVQQGLLLMTPISFFGSKVPLPGGEPECGPDEYKPEGLSRCCKQCPAGSHVSADCGVNHGVTICSPCEPESFLSHPNEETSCQPCTQCRADQEMVAACTRTRDRQCQCASGSFFCDSPSCVENCFRCRSLQTRSLKPGVSGAELPLQTLGEDPASPLPASDGAGTPRGSWAYLPLLLSA